MGQLELDGIVKKKISSIGSKIIEQKKVKRLSGKVITESGVCVDMRWFVTAREQGYIDPHYSQPKTLAGEKPKTNFDLENGETISVIDQMMELLKSEKQFLKHNYRDSKIEKNILYENIYAMTHEITHANERFHNKLKMTPSPYSTMFMQFMESMPSHLSAPYYLHVSKKEGRMRQVATRIRTKPIEYTVQRLNPTEGMLSDLLLREARGAYAKGHIPVLACCGHWCQSCRDLFVSMGDKLMIDTFKGVHIVKVDIDDWQSQLYDHGFAMRSVPHFELLNDAGKPCGMSITGAAWGDDDTARGIAPHLKKFFGKCREKTGRKNA